MLETSELRQSSINFYGEYGLKDHLALIVQGPLLRINSFETTEAVFGQGDLRLDLKYRLIEKTIPTSISAGIELPTGRANAFATSLEVPEESINLPTGDGEFNFWTTLAASKSLNKWYASAFAAFNFRTSYEGESFQNLYKIGGEVGYQPIANLFLNTKLQAQYSTGESESPALGFLRGDATSFTLFSAEAMYFFKENWGLSGTFFTGNDWLAPYRNIYIAPFFSVGIIYQQKPSKS